MPYRPASVLVALGCLALTCTLRTQPAPTAATGTIEGRVLNMNNGEYVENARITVEGTNLEAASNPDGTYRLTGVPAGTVQMRAFFTGLATRTDAVTVTAGQIVRHDISLAPLQARPGSRVDGTIVKLDEFVVGASREMDAAAIAINEQRFAPNVKTIVSTDEFGTVAEGHAGEFLKYLPGVTMEYQGGNARDVSIDGVPAANVPVTVDGFSLASAISNGTGRGAAVDMVSINSLSRIEVSYSPTPESQGAALAGSVNMVPRSSFERSRPVFNGSLYVMMRDYRRELHPTPSPREQRTRKVYPGFDFSWVVPVNKRFGYTLSGGRTRQYAGQDLSQRTWRGTGTATNGNAFPHTTPDQPYLSTYTVRDGGKETTRNSLGATLDYRLTANDRLSFSLQVSTFEESFNQRALTFNVNRVLAGNFTPEWIHGATGFGSLQAVNSGNYRLNRTYMPTLTWRHDGPIWRADAGVGLSRARYTGNDIDRGFFNSVTTQRSGVTVSFDDIFYLRPGVVTVTDGATGAPLDPYKLDNYVVTALNSNRPESNDLQRTAYANLRRDFAWRVPFSLKTGLDLRQSVRDLRGGTIPFTYVGRDGRASTTPVGSDDSAGPLWAPEFSEHAAPYGFPPIEWAGQRAAWSYYQANPGSFVLDRNAEYRNAVALSKKAQEVVSAAYVRGDLALFDRRLKLVGGVRVEQTNLKAEGPLTDATRNFQRDAGGRVLPGSNGRPLTIIPATDTLGVSQLTYLDRGAHTDKEYLRIFPSLNASFNVRDNLIARVAQYASVGRPDFNQYAGGITLPDTESPPTPGNRITVNNAGIKAWSAQTTKVRLEYYFEGVGQLSVGAFRRDFKNFFGGTVFNATPEFLALYGLDPAIYDTYDVSTQENLPGRVRMTGVDVSYKQALTFLPRWARGVQVFANASAQRATGEASENFAGYIPRSGSWGVSLTRPKYNTRINWNYRGRQRRGIVASGASIEPGTYTWGSKRLYIDVSGEYYFRKAIALFANLRNIGDATEDQQIFGPNTPAVARFRQRLDFGSLWTFGLRGTF